MDKQAKPEQKEAKKEEKKRIKNEKWISGKCGKCGKIHFNCFCCENPETCPIHGHI